MAADDHDSPPSLEPPRLVGRRRKAAHAAADGTADGAADGAVFTDVGTDAPQEPPARAATPAAPAAAPAAGATAARRGRRLPRLPRLPHPGAALAVPRYAGAAAAGLVTGVGLVTLAWLGLRGCEAITGSVSCGPGPGMVALIAVFAVAVVLGSVLLGLLQVPEAGMTSFFAVGLTSLVVVLAPEGLLDGVVALVVLPLLGAATFAASSWVATLQLDPDA